MIKIFILFIKWKLHDLSTHKFKVSLAQFMYSVFFRLVLKVEGSLLSSKACRSLPYLIPSPGALSGTSHCRSYTLLVCPQMLSVQLNSHQPMRKTPFSLHPVTDTVSLTSTYSEQDSIQFAHNACFHFNSIRSDLSLPCHKSLVKVLSGLCVVKCVAVSLASSDSLSGV